MSGGISVYTESNPAVTKHSCKLHFFLYNWIMDPFLRSEIQLTMLKYFSEMLLNSDVLIFRLHMLSILK